MRRREEGREKGRGWEEEGGEGGFYRTTTTLAHVPTL